MSRSSLPDHLKDAKHWDWPWPLSLVPRAWTSWDWGKPEMIWGNQEREYEGLPLPIGEPGSWQVSRYPNLWGPFKYLPIYWAFTLKGGRHFRIGARYDDIDEYVTFPTIATRRFPPDGDRDTSTL